jgi:SEC-C motif
MTKDSSAPAITKGILKLARQIDSTSAPEYVVVEPGDGCDADSCFRNVTAMTRRHGGTTQHGWRMREQPAVFVEGQFHAVWRRPDGELLDVTPRTDGLSKILFLPDSKAVWDGSDVEPRRMMLHEKPCYCGSGMPFKICHGLADD